MTSHLPISSTSKSIFKPTPNQFLSPSKKPHIEISPTKTPNSRFLDLKPFGSPSYRPHIETPPTTIRDRVDDLASPSDDPMMLKDSPFKQANRTRRRQSRISALPSPPPSKRARPASTSSCHQPTRLSSRFQEGEEDEHLQSHSDHPSTIVRSFSPPSVSPPPPPQPPSRGSNPQTGHRHRSHTRTYSPVRSSPPFEQIHDLVDPDSDSNSPSPSPAQPPPPSLPEPDLISFSTPPRAPSSRSPRTSAVPNHARSSSSSSSQYLEFVEERIVISHSPSSSNSVIQINTSSSPPSSSFTPRPDSNSRILSESSQGDLKIKTPLDEPSQDCFKTIDRPPSIDDRNQTFTPTLHRLTLKDDGEQNHVKEVPQRTTMQNSDQDGFPRHGIKNDEDNSGLQNLTPTPNRSRLIEYDQTSTQTLNLTRPILIDKQRTQLESSKLIRPTQNLDCFQKSTPNSSRSRTQPTPSPFHEKAPRPATPPKPREWNKHNAFTAFEVEIENADDEVEVTITADDTKIPNRKRRISMGHVELVLKNWPLGRQARENSGERSVSIVEEEGEEAEAVLDGLEEEEMEMEGREEGVGEELRKEEHSSSDVQDVHSSSEEDGREGFKENGGEERIRVEEEEQAGNDEPERFEEDANHSSHVNDEPLLHSQPSDERIYSGEEEEADDQDRQRSRTSLAYQTSNEPIELELKGSSSSQFVPSSTQTIDPPRSEDHSSDSDPKNQDEPTPTPTSHPLELQPSTSTSPNSFNLSLVHHHHRPEVSQVLPPPSEPTPNSASSWSSNSPSSAAALHAFQAQETSTQIASAGSRSGKPQRGPITSCPGIDNELHFETTRVPPRKLTYPSLLAINQQLTSTPSGSGPVLPKPPAPFPSTRSNCGSSLTPRDSIPNPQTSTFISNQLNLTPTRAQSPFKPSRVVQVSSSDPRIAAQAAAILNVYHGFIPRGCKVEEKEDHVDNDLLLQQEMEISIRREQAKIERSIGLSVEPINVSEVVSLQDVQQNHLGQLRAGSSISETGTIEENYKPDMEKWTTVDWKKLDKVLKRSQKVWESKGNKGDVETKIVVKKLLESLGLKVEDCKSKWEWSALVRRVKALQTMKRRSSKGLNGKSLYDELQRPMTSSSK
ncbi:hypothetical protein CROQUDRAFT_664932 [Cronartium quercuum f. sp. fusiforme G11]|uniref:Uncharacterized protein n=1 Tax=Cronartium quercuum f. sp. fusiforme G11 TaxID=708437 RepID=A0A9P6NBC0_9BASI|nr:hypothetical protein CROQUDRAFT_664932 [Cronartium quercuum f. sp. fusiforme G11]